MGVYSFSRRPGCWRENKVSRTRQKVAARAVYGAIALVWTLCGVAAAAPTVVPITYNQEIETLLTSQEAHFDLYDWDGDGSNDIIGVRARKGLTWHRNAGRADGVLFEPGWISNEPGQTPPRLPEMILEDRRMGRAFAFLRPNRSNGKPFVVSIEMFATTREMGSRPLAMHAWKRTDGAWQYVQPVDANGNPYSFPGDLWMSPVVEAADWNGDGRTDLLVGAMVLSEAFPEKQFPNAHRFRADSFNYEAGRVYFLENLSERDGELRFAEPVAVRAGTEPIRGRGWTYPRAIDLTGDGRLDLVVGNNRPGLRAFLNKGTATDPRLVEFGYLADENGRAILSTTVIMPAFGDIDGDGRVEMVATAYPGAPQYYRLFRHTGEGNLLRGWQDQGYLKIKTDADTPIVGPGISTVEMVDWTGRGVRDLLLGAEPGIPMLVRNVGTERERRFLAPERLRWTNGQPIELHAIETGAGSNWGPIETHIERFLPRAGDWDGDGVPDILTGSMGMRLLWLRGVRVDGDVRFERPRALRFAGDELEVAHRTQPYLIDYDRDGSLDVVALSPENEVTVYYGDGTARVARSEALLGTDGKPIQLHSNVRGSNSGRAGIALADWTGDGRLDLLVYKRPGGGRLYRNDGLPEVDRFRAEPENLFSPVAGHNSGITPYDWDGDGGLDLLVGGGPGAFLYVIDGQTTEVKYGGGTASE